MTVVFLARLKFCIKAVLRPKFQFNIQTGTNQFKLVFLFEKKNRIAFADGMAVFVLKRNMSLSQLWKLGLKK